MSATTLSLPQDRVQPQTARASSTVVDVCILGAGFGTSNLGVNALTEGTFCSALNAFPQARLWLLDYGRTPASYQLSIAGREIEIPMVNMRFSKKFYLSNNIAVLLLLACLVKLFPIPAFRRRILEGNRCLRQIQNSTFVAAIAGGDSFSDIYGVSRFLYVSLPQILVLLLKKPLVLLPQTYGPFNRGFVRSIACWILRRASLVYSRDQAGLQVVRDLLGQNARHASFAYDLGFALEPAPPDASVLDQLRQLTASDRPIVGLNISGLLYAGGYSGDNMFGLKNDYREMIHALLRFLIIELKAQVLLVPHVFGDNMESDLTACQTMFRSLQPEYGNHLRLFNQEFDQRRIKFIIGQCDFFLGSRMHACIAALSQCVPAVGLAYSRKFAGVLDAIGGGATVVDLRRADVNEISRAVGQAFINRKALQKQLEARMPEIKQSVLNLFISPEFNEVFGK
jgi:polysaccharide pyruvyl transferase WcaK-like protein